MNSKVWRIAVLVAGSYLAVCGQAQAQTYYFNYLGNRTLAQAINTSGLVVGQGAASGGSFTWLNGAYTDLGNPYQALVSVNDSGQFAGQITAGPITQVGATRWTGATQTLLPFVDGSMATDINNAGQVVGLDGANAVLWDATGTKQTVLKSLGGASSALAVNKSGQVAGYSTDTLYTEHAVLWSGGKVTDLGSLGGGSGVALGINDSGSVVGKSTLATGNVHAALWSGSKITDLGTLTGATESVAQAINSSGLVVGYSTLANNALTQHATMWQNGKIVDLNSFLDAATVSAGWVLNQAVGVNDNGWIIGSAYNSQFQAGGSFVLSTTAIGYTPPPVPEPGTYVLTVLGLGAAVVVARKRRA